MRKKVQARVANQKLECANICALGDKENMEFSVRAQYLTFTSEKTLYSLKCRKQEVQLATDWNTHIFFRVKTALEQLTTRELHLRQPLAARIPGHLG